MKHQPPKIPLRFLRWFCKPELLRYVEGDLIELFEENLHTKGDVRSRWIFALDVLKLLRPSMIRKFTGLTNFFGLFQNHLKSSVRMLSRQKFYATIIISSMVVAFTLIQLLTSFLIKVEEVDGFVENSTHKYRLMTDDPFDQGRIQAYVLDKQIDYIRENYPNYKDLTSIYLSGMSKIKVEDVMISNPVTIGVDSNFLDFFNFKLNAGNASTAIAHGSAVISKSLAVRLFGDSDPVGQVLEAVREDSSRLLQISGVLDMEAHNSHLKFDIMVHEKSFQVPYGGAHCYLELYEEANVPEFAKVMSQDPNIPFLWRSDSSHFELQHIKEAYYDQKNGGWPFSRTISRQFVLVGWCVAAMILLISMLNFVNLFLLSSIKRRKELGIKKVLGVSLTSIRAALAVDVGIYLLIALATAFITSLVLVGQFNFRFEASLVEMDLFQPKVLMLLGALLLFILIAALMYSFTRINASPMRMMVKSVDFKVRINKFLLTPQFAVSIILGICSLLIMQQVEYIRNKPLGFDREILALTARGEEGQRALKILKQQVLDERIVDRAALSTGSPVSGISKVGLDLPEGGRYTPNFISGDQDLLETLGIPVVHSMNDTINGAFVNETFVKQFSWDAPLGKDLPGMGGKVAGVLADFNVLTFYESIPPFVINIKDESYDGLLLNYRNRSMNEVLAAVSAKWVKLLPDVPFVYDDLQIRIMELHRNETRLLNIVIAFASGGILIACFGLFALSWSIIQNRTKEVGIRKVVGASMRQVMMLLSGDFLKWVIIAFVVACPVSFLLIHNWLEHFAFRIAISPVVFISVGVLSSFLALAIVGFHALKVASINPVESLKDE
jgi:putative ABC transport system permease protein